MKRLLLGASLAAGIAASGLWMMRAQEPQQNPDELKIQHADCAFFGPQRERFVPRDASERFRLSRMTAQVTSMLGNQMASQSVEPATAAMPSAPGGSRTFTKGQAAGSSSGNLIDVFIYQAFNQQGVKPAGKTDDFEFIRRVTLDLTGRIPVADRVVSFVADGAPDKRAKLVDELLAKPEWLDKWTMFYGDLYKNASVETSAGLNRYPQGRDAYNTWIRNALSSGKPYDQMARELISAKGSNNFTQGELNWLYNGYVTNVNIRQDTFDQQAANVAETFLGIAHMNCVLCHNGRGRLDSLSLWGSSFARTQAWGFSAFLSHTQMKALAVDPSVNNGPRYWWPEDNTPGYTTDYALNTTTGNRPARQPLPSGARTMAAVYPFSGNGPKSGENYRDALAREVTADFQFARAAVNYVWAAFFGRGMVDPPDQFDPARLDPANPPPDPWTLQPSNPDLLNALAQDFIDSKYDIKHLMRLITTSDTYQLSSRYDPAAWNPNWEPRFARKLVRRLWGEEIADSIALSSNIPNTFTAEGNKFSWAMQLGEPRLEPAFLQAFLPGNRDDQPRRADGAIQQALGLMNDPMVMSKLTATGSGATQSLLGRALAGGDDNLIYLLYINILSRNPTDAEKQTAAALLSSGNRTQKAQELMWTLYNKVDFIFNY